MISEKEIMMKSCSVFHTERKMEFEKFNCFFVGFFKSSFGRINVHINWLVYMIGGFTERYFLSFFILESHFYFLNALDYCFWPYLFRIFCKRFWIVLLRKTLGSYILHIIALDVHYLQKERKFTKRKKQVSLLSSSPNTWWVQRWSRIMCLHKFSGRGIELN